MLTAYNAGRWRAHGWLEQKGWDYAFNELDAILYSATRGYVASVLKDRDKYHLLYKDKLRYRSQQCV